MKNKWKIIILIIIILAIIATFFSVNFIKNARQDRTWPFNSGIQLPPIFKYYAYKYTNPDSLKIKTHYYEIATEYVSIPDKEAIGGGGGINFIDEQNLLITLNNGNNWTLNLPTKTFRKGTDIFTNKFLSIRDINIFPQRKEIALLVGEYNKSKCIVMKLKIYNFNFLEKKLDIVNEKTIWKSEEMCEDSSPYISNGGGRVVFYKNSYFISLGFLAGNFYSGAYHPFSQDSNSSFGKIIRIFDENKSEIYSKGHKNPQGLFVRKKNDQLISTEHGPKGGDELNLIIKNANYGWPCKTFGTMYNYSYNKNDEIWPKDLKDAGCKEDEIFTEPLYSWTPSIGASQGFEYRGDEFPQMKNDLITSSLVGGSLFRINLSDSNSVINIERIRLNERIRDLTESPSGKIVLYTDGGSLIFLSNNRK